MISRPRNIAPLISHDQFAALPLINSGAKLSYHGGPLLANVRVQTIFWGVDWQTTQQAALIPRLEQFFRFILGSSLMDLLAEYSAPGFPIGHGQFLGSVNPLTPALTSPLDDSQIQQALQGWIAHGTVVQPDANTLYFIYLPPGVVSTLNGQRSCSTFCGYHNHIAASVFYAVEPFIDCPGCNFGSDIFDSLTKISSHELCEAITDPALNAWFDDTSPYNEIGDICNSGVANLGEFVVQSEWSNLQQACVFAPGALKRPIVRPERMGILQASSLFVKEGSLNAPWILQASGVRSFALLRNRIAIVDFNNNLFVSEGALNAPWVLEATDVQSFALYEDPVDLMRGRMAILDGGARLFIKEGALNAAWELKATGIRSFFLSGSRIAVLDFNNNLFVNEGPLNAQWVWAATGVQSVALGGGRTVDRIAVLDQSSNLSVQEGPLNAGWSLEAMGIRQFALSEHRIAVLDTANKLSIKEGPINAGWSLEATGIRCFALSADRLAALDAENKLSVKEGSSESPWVLEATGIDTFGLSPAPP